MPAQTFSQEMMSELSLIAKKITKTSWIVFFLQAGSAFASPAVSNLNAAQRPGTKLVDIGYDLAAPGFATVAVKVEASSDGGATWTVPVQTVSGDVGATVPVGSGKALVWDAGADWPLSYSTQMRFRVTADDGFSLIPGGEFTMGRTSGDTDSDAPPITATVSSFYLQQKETTKAQWDEVRTWAVNNGYTDLAVGAGKASNHPVQMVSWWDVVKWCNARSEKEGLTPVYTVSGAVMRTGAMAPDANWTANGYRLPTEAEWEKAARGGVSGKRFPWGTDAISHALANYRVYSLNGTTNFYIYDVEPRPPATGTNYYHPSYTAGGQPYSSPVGSFGPNAYGLYDMAGNVWEWCWDWYGSSYYSTSNGTTDPRGPASGTLRVIRGGSWYFYASNARCASRDNRNTPGGKDFDYGFRPARSAVNEASRNAQTGDVTVDSRDAQTITFGPIPDKLTTDSVDLTATGGGSSNPVTFAVTDGPGVITNNVLTFTTSGSVTVTASQAGNSNYLAAEDVSRTFNVTKVPASVTLASLAQTFDGMPRVVTATTNPADLTVVFTYDGSATSPTNAGSYAVVATINDLIYQGSATGTLEIGKASQAIAFAAIPDKITTDSVTLTATGGDSGNPVTFAVTSGPGVITDGVLTFTTSGSVTITASQAGNDNYLAAEDVSRTFNVTKATAPVTLASLAQTFDGTPRVATATTDPADLAVVFTYDGSATPPTNAGTYAVVATINDLIYQGSTTGALEIGKAAQAITFAAIPDKLTTDSVNLTATGGDSGNPVNFAVTSGPGVITNNVLTFTTAGSVTITASQVGNDNYLAAEDVVRTFNVTKATAPVTLASLAQTFDGTPRVATATTYPADLTVVFSYDGSATPPTNAGTYAVVATINDPIYQGSASGTLEIGKASQAITFAVIPDKLTTDSVNLTATGGDSGNPVTFAVTSGPGVITNNVLTFTTSGSVTITASQAGNENYLAAEDVSRTFSVTKATAPVSLASLAQTFDGTPRVAKATTDPAGLTVVFTYDGSATAPTNAGSYAVVATINDLIYQGSATGTLEIGKAAQVISFAAIPDKLTTDLVNLTATGGDSGNPVTFAVTSGPGVITNNVLTFTTSGSITITASQAGNANYLAAEDVSRTFNVTKATAPVTLASLAQTYNGTPRVATASTVPAGLVVNFTYDGSSTAPTAAGSYAVVGTINDLMYQGSATGTLEIGKTSQAITFAAIPDKLTTDSVTLTATGGDSGNPVTFAVTSGPGVITNNVLTFTTSGSVTITASQAGNGNYLAAEDVSRTFNVTKATAPVTMGSLAQTYKGTPHVATASTVPAGLVVNFTYDGSLTAPTAAGSYAVVGTINDLMYQGSATGTLEIGKASQAITFAAIPDKLATDSVTLTATGGGSGNPVTFAVTSGPGEITDGVLTFTTSGTVTVTASQARNDNYLAAEDVIRTFNVTKATSSIQFANLLHVDDGTPRSATFTTDPADLPYALLYAGSETAPSLPGHYGVTASLDDLLYSGSGNTSLTILGLSGRGQRLLSGSESPQEANGTEFGRVVLGRVATQTFTITNPGSEPVNLTGDPLVEILGEQAGDFQISVPPAAEIPAGGSVSFEVRFAPTQPGDRQAVVQLECADLANGPITFAVGGFGALPALLPQTITFNLPSSLYLSQSPVPLLATASSGLPVILTVLEGPATLSDGELQVTEPGKIRIEARQAGFGNFTPAKPVVRTLTVKADPTGLTLADLTQTYNGTPRPITVLGTEEEATVTYLIDKELSDQPPTNAGTYPVTAVAGPVTKKGTLVIARAPLIVQVTDQRKLVGEANPSFNAELSGFIGEDNENTVLFRPITLSTKAKDSSPPGLYPILSSGGATANYTLIHRPGTLVVEGHVGSFEALLRDPDTDLPVGLLKLTVPSTGRSLTANLALAGEAKPITLAGPLELDSETRVASVQVSRVINKTDTYQLDLTLSLFGELAVEVRKNEELIAQANDGTRLRDAVKGESVPQVGAYTMVLEPGDEDNNAPSAPGWATAKLDAAGTLALAGRLGDGTAFTASLPVGVSDGYRLFVQPYKRGGAHLGGSWTMTEHPDVEGAWQARGVDLTWVKGPNEKDPGYRAGFGPLTVALEMDAWQPPSKTVTLAELLGTEQMEVSYDPTGSPSEGLLPTLVALDRSNNLLVLAPETNPLNLRKWKAKVNSATGSYSGSFELLDLSQKRKVNFTGVLRQATDAEGDGLQGRGHYILPPLKGAVSKETTTGRIEFRRPD